MRLKSARGVWPCGEKTCPRAFGTRKAVSFHELEEHGFELPEEYKEEKR